LEANGLTVSGRVALSWTVGEGVAVSGLVDFAEGLFGAAEGDGDSVLTGELG
jgi:hypothetical protein